MGVCTDFCEFDVTDNGQNLRAAFIKKILKEAGV